MTAKQYRDQYAKDEGFDDWIHLVRALEWDTISEHTAQVMKAYALSVLPEQRSDLPKPSPLREIVETMNVGWNDCIDQIKKNIR